MIETLDKHMFTVVGVFLILIIGFINPQFVTTGYLWFLFCGSIGLNAAFANTLRNKKNET